MKARIGIIGGGIYGTQMLKAYAAAHKRGQIELAALADINDKVVQEQAARFNIKGYTDYKHMLAQENLDAVAVVTPDYLHREIALEVAGRGVHMLVQKPLDVTSRGGRDMIQAARDNKVMLYVDFHKRFDPGHIQLKKDIKSGKLGKIQYGYVWMEDKIVVPAVWFRKWAQHSSPAWFIGIHFYDLIYWLLEAEPVAVYASGRKDKLAAMGIDTYDCLQAKIEFANGASFTVDASWTLPESFPSIVNQGIRVVGTNGIAEVDSQDRGILCAYEADQASKVPNPYGSLDREDPIYGDVPQGYTIESMLYFLDMVNLLKNGKTLGELQGLYPTGEEALVSTRLCEAIHASAQQRKIIEL